MLVTSGTLVTLRLGASEPFPSPLAYSREQWERGHIVLYSVLILPRLPLA